jgi:exodeoxyribonuclease V alpha subunit
MPELAAAEDSDFYFVEAADPEDGVRKVVTIVRERIPKRFGFGPVRDIQVLCPMNRGGLGARSLNVELQAALNPPGDIRMERFGWTFCPGDKVMQVENNYDKEVYNGDLGIVSRLDAEEGELSVDFDGGRWFTGSPNSTSWCWPTPQRSTKVRAPNTQLWSSRSQPNTTRCCSGTWSTPV